jgi:putative ABC transport system permease protein
MWQDVRYSVRTLAKHPSFVLVAVMVLALGIGLNTALFSIVSAVLFRPLPVDAPEELVYVYVVFPRQPDRPQIYGGDMYEFLRDHNEAFSSLTGNWGVSLMLSADGETDSTRGEWVFANYFDVLGVKPMFGRGLRVEDDALTSTERSVVISCRLWTRRFKQDPAIIGKEIRLGRWAETPDTFTVVGVMAPEFKGISDPWTPSDFWLTFAHGLGKDARRVGFGVIGRRKPHLSVQQVQAIVTQQGEQWQDSRKVPVPKQYRYRVVGYPASSIKMPFDPKAAVVPLRLAAALTIVVTAVLLISATNIAGLLIARGVSRTGELAIRLVLGAGARRIARQLLIESVLLAVLGGALGLVGAGWLLNLFRTYTPNRFAIDVPMDVRVVAYTALVCLGVGIVIGVVPAIRAARVDLLASLPGAGIGTMRRIRSRLRQWVVIPQVALSLVLLMVAAVHVRALMTIELANLGYTTDHSVVLSFSRRGEPVDEKADLKALAEKNAARSRLFYRQMLGRFAGTGADSVALTTTLPLHTRQSTDYSAVAQEDFLAGDAKGIGSSVASVSPGYFQTMGMRLENGRDFDERDSMNTPHVAIVSASIARRLWPGRDPVGRVVAARNSFPAANEKIEWLEVIGVVNEIDPILRDVGQSPFIYKPLSQQWRMDAGTLVARVAGDPQSVVQRLRQAITGADASAEVFRVQTMRQMVAEILYPKRMSAGILAASGLVGLLLACVGLYGVISYSLAQRVHELGIRVALGAERAHIIRMVLREGLALTAIGSVIGFGLTYAAIRITSRMFVAVPALDLVTFVTVPLLLAAVILLACYLPARRAAVADPMIVLRRL